MKIGVLIDGMSALGTNPDGLILESVEAIEAAFTEWQHYVEGNIYRVEVLDPDGESIDALGCIYGYEAAELEGEYIIDYQLSLPRAGHKPMRASALHS